MTLKLQFEKSEKSKSTASKDRRFYFTTTVRYVKEWTLEDIIEYLLDFMPEDERNRWDASGGEGLLRELREEEDWLSRVADKIKTPMDLSRFIGDAGALDPKEAAYGYLLDAILGGELEVLSSEIDE